MHTTRPTGLAAGIAAVVTAATLALTAAPAGAQSVTVADERGDVTAGRFGGVSDTDRADILTTTLDHRSSRVVMRLSMLDVSKQVRTTVRGRLRTPSGATFTAELDSPAVGEGAKTVSLTKDGAESPRTCDGLRGSLLAARDELVISVPRACLRNPRTIRFGALVRVSPPSTVNYYDDARLDGGVNPTGYQTKIGSREVRRG